MNRSVGSVDARRGVEVCGSTDAFSRSSLSHSPQPFRRASLDPEVSKALLPPALRLPSVTKGRDPIVLWVERRQEWAGSCALGMTRPAPVPAGVFSGCQDPSMASSVTPSDPGVWVNRFFHTTRDAAACCRLECDARPG